MEMVLEMGLGLEDKWSNPCPPLPGTESGSSAPFPTLPPSFLGTPDPAHLGLPEGLASVTVPIRLDALSYLLHSALLGAYNLQQSLTCPCSPETCCPQSGPPSGQGVRDIQQRRGCGQGQGQRRLGRGRAEKPKRRWPGGSGAGPKTPLVPPVPPPPPAKNERKEAQDLEPPPDILPAAEEDWESEY
ncbi:uncharacterized protein C19orf84 homolog [Echinops telfairi]|uniref:Uncharacterized protein C19orf84 homolog n=1 Tax=Echinops telfairi TaxID=9371 RepID=A0ABM0ZSE7_ECHTE|nr:uncharacterized protein C19orf84 homolog [Echinops telfairi]